MFEALCIDSLDLTRIRSEIRHSAEGCAARKLITGSAWLSELLLALPDSLPSVSDEGSSSVADMNETDSGPAGKLQASEMDRIRLAQAYYDTKEYARAAHSLKQCDSDQAKFLRIYACYLDSQRAHTEMTEPLLGRWPLSIPEILIRADKGAGINDNGKLINRHLWPLLKEIGSPADSYLLYMYVENHILYNAQGP